MARGSVYAIISTKDSEKYTELAVSSFFKNTKLHAKDEFYLIDNDNTGAYRDRPFTTLSNVVPKSYAQNINEIIRIANGKDIIILNNDIVFTPGWSEPLTQYNNVVLLPCCNQTHLYSFGDLCLTDLMTLDQYSSEQDLNAIVDQHRSAVKLGFFENLIMPFYAFRLPYNIYSKVGLFDETFGPGGGEDIDYRIRVVAHGFSVKYITRSYLLHFHGKSTWAGPESSNDTQSRNSKYHQVFSQKWGLDFANLFLTGGNGVPVIDKYRVRQLVENKKYTALISQMLYLKNNSIVQLDQVSANGLLPYVRKLGTNLVGCELGVCLGFTLRYFLDLAPEISKVYAVDAWQPYMDHWGPVTREMVDRWKIDALNLLSPYADKLRVLEMNSIDAAKLIQPNELDYIFIDGDHSYSAVLTDLDNYWEKVRPGGIFAGHDWNLPDVNRAVNQFRQQRKITSEIKFAEKNVWFWYK